MNYQGDNIMGVKRKNRSAALRLLHERGGLSRKRLAEATGLTPAAISKIVAEMIGEGLLREGEALPGGGAGRREIRVELAENARAALGIFWNLGQAILSAVWLDGTVIFSEAVPLAPDADAEEAEALLAARLLELAGEHGLSRDRILGLGLAVRGIPSSDERSVVDSFGLFRQEHVPLCARMEALTGYPAVMTNNVRALLSAQMFLDPDEEGGSPFLLRCESGIGAALAIRGQLWTGGSQQCAEIGHIPVDPRNGKPCRCGKRGCLETIASPAAVREEARGRLSPSWSPLLWQRLAAEGGRAPELYDILDAARDGDPGPDALVQRAVTALASALKSVIYLIDPDRIILYGPMFAHRDYLDRLQEQMREGLDQRHRLNMENSRFNGQLEEKAAGILAVEKYLKNGGYPI